MTEDIGSKKKIPSELEMLEEVLEVRVGQDQLKQIMLSLKLSTGPNSGLISTFTYGEKLSNGDFLDPISETDTDLVSKVANRLYKKRCAALHSKKTRKRKPEHNINPSQNESFGLEADLAIMSPIAEFLVENADPDE